MDGGIGDGGLGEEEALEVTDCRVQAMDGGSGEMERWSRGSCSSYSYRVTAPEPDGWWKSEAVRM